jgi:hypothetical protein
MARRTTWSPVRAVACPSCSRRARRPIPASRRPSRATTSRTPASTEYSTCGRWCCRTALRHGAAAVQSHLSCGVGRRECRRHGRPHPLWAVPGGQLGRCRHGAPVRIPLGPHLRRCGQPAGHDGHADRHAYGKPGGLAFLVDLHVLAGGGLSRDLRRRRDRLDLGRWPRGQVGPLWGLRARVPAGIRTPSSAGDAIAESPPVRADPGRGRLVTLHWAPLRVCASAHYWALHTADCHPPPRKSPQREMMNGRWPSLALTPSIRNPR